MFEQPFYPELIKKTIIGFGALFSNVKIIRRNQQGVTVEIVKVPIAYGPKEKFITRVDADPQLSAGVYITLPRFSYEITGYNYDSSEMTNRNNKIQCQKTDGTSYMYTPVPYNINIQLNLITKGTEDQLAVLEQILPLFRPEYTLTINAVPEMNVSVDIPIELQGVSISDDYEGDFATRRFVIHTFEFTAKIKLFGPVINSGLIYRTESTIESPFNTEHVAQADPNTGNIILDQWSQI